MTLLTDLEEFVTEHRCHGRLGSEVGDLTPNGYRLHLACPCGVVFERWITPEEPTAGRRPPHQATCGALTGTLALTPLGRDGQRGVRFTGPGTFGKILTGEAAPLTVVPPG